MTGVYDQCRTVKMCIDNRECFGPKSIDSCHIYTLCYEIVQWSMANTFIYYLQYSTA